MQERLSAIVGARITEFRRQMARVNQTMRRTASGVVVNVRTRMNKTQEKLDRVARTLSAIQILSSNFGKGTLISISPATIPIIASLAGGLGAVSSAFVVAGGAAVAFGAVAIPTISKLFGETGKLTASQKAARGEFDKFNSTWKGIVKDLEKPVLQAFSKAMQAANKALKMARPLFDGAAKAVNNLLESLNTSLDSSPVKAFFDYMNKQGGPMLEKMGKSMGNFMQGFMSLMVAFGPLAEDFANGLLKMSKRFAEWAAGLSESEKFKSFVAYVQTNGPKVLSLIGQLTTFLINLGTGIAPLGSKMMELVTRFFSWTNSMMEANPQIAKMIGYGIVIGGILKGLGPILFTVGSFFSGFGTKLAEIATKVGSKLMPFLTKIGSTILRLGTTFLTNAARIASSWLIAMGPIGWVTAAVAGLVILVIANWEKVKEWTTKIWSAVSKFVSDSATKILGYIKEKFPALYKVIQSYMKMAQDIISTVLNFVKGTFKNVLSFLKSLVKGDFQGMKDAISNQMELSKSTISKIWGSIKSFFGSVLSQIWSKVKQKFADIVRSVGQKMADVKNKVQDGINKVKSFLSGIDLSQMGKNMIQGLINGIGSMAKNLVRKAKGVVNGAINAAKSLLGIHSPSRVFMQIGKYTGEGMAIGMDKSNSLVKRSSQSMAKASIVSPATDFGTIRRTNVNTSSLAETTPSSIGRTRTNETGDSKVEIPLIVEGYEVARAIIDDINELLESNTTTNMIVNGVRG
jgi:phage-related protein